MLAILFTAAVAARGLRPQTSSPASPGPAFAEARPLPGKTAPVAGEMAPDFEILHPDGRRTRLSDLRGRPVIINFWASWCGPCRVEMPELVRVYEAHREAGLTILAVNLEEPEDRIQAFAQEFRIPFPVLRDPEGRLADRYQIHSLPSSIFIGRDGVIAARWIGLLTPSLLEKHLRRIL